MMFGSTTYKAEQIKCALDRVKVAATLELLGISTDPFDLIQAKQDALDTGATRKQIERALPVLQPLPPMDCENCVYHTESWRDGGHCYMFREQPSGDRCGQFHRKPTRIFDDANE